MKINEALELITQVISDFRGTLKDHQTLQNALQVIKDNLVAEKVKEVKTEKTA